MLDVLRAAKSFPAFFSELQRAKGLSSKFDEFLALLTNQVQTLLRDGPLALEAQRAGRLLACLFTIRLSLPRIMDGSFDFLDSSTYSKNVSTRKVFVAILSTFFIPSLYSYSIM